MGKKRAPLQLGAKQWARFVAQPATLLALAEEQQRANDILKEIAQGCLPGGALHAAGLSLRLQVVALLEQHAVALCGDAPTDLMRQLYECIRDRAASVAADGPAGAARMQLAALKALNALMLKLEMHQRDARLVKVHIEMLFRVLERSGLHAAATPELCHCAATCLRRLEQAAPTLLLAGSKQLLELARQESTAAAEGYAMLAGCVLSHGAARCLDLKQQSSKIKGEEESAAAAAAARGGALASSAQLSTGGVGRPAEEEEEEQGDALSAFSSIDVRALALEAAGGGSGGSGGSHLLHPACSGAGVFSPSATLDCLQNGHTPFASQRTDGSSLGTGSPKEAPGSPRCVASILGTVSTLDSTHALSAAVEHEAAATAVPGSAAPPCPLIAGRVLATSEISGSVQLDATAPQALLSAAGPGLRHYRVPQHLHWPDALAHTALCVYVTPEAQQDVQKACLEFLAVMPKLTVEGVACLTAALPDIMRLADLPPLRLQEALDGMLQGGETPAARTLMLQATLKLYSAVPEGFAEWQGRLVDTVLMMVNGPHPPEHRVIAITWALVQHHAQQHAGQASLFAGNWRQLMPRADDPAQLLSLKVKALSACLAVGIGHPEEICPMVFAWDGFWQAAPSDQQQRLITYALRMLGSAAVSFAALSPRAQRAACEAAGNRPPASPQYVTACLVSACLQLLATRPQYLPGVQAFLANCGSCCSGLQQTLLNAIDALFSAAATGSFTSLHPLASQTAAQKHKQRSSSGWLSGSSAAAAPTFASGSKGTSKSHGEKEAGVGGMLQRMRRSVSKRLASHFSVEPPGAAVQHSTSRLSAASLTRSSASGTSASAAQPGLGLAPIAEAALCSLAAPQPPASMASWEDAEAWLWDSRTWATLSTNMLAHDPMAYRSLLLCLAQSGTGVLPMGTLRLLAAYSNQYQGELPGQELPAKEAGSCVLAICQAAAMTHLLVGPAGPSAKCGRGRAASRAGDEGGSVRGGSPDPAAAGSDAAQGSATPQWTLQQEEVAAAMQAVLSALTSKFPTEGVRRRAQSFLDLLANPSAWDLRVRMGTMAKMLGGYFSEAVSCAAYL